jgi:internalin A
MDINQVREVIDEAQKDNRDELHLSYRNLTELPDEIIKLNNLTYLDLSHNRIKIFPRQLLKMPSLKKLVLNNNKIDKLPNKLDNLKSLEILNLRKNNLFDLPDSMVNMTSLEKLDLHDNPLLEIPPEIIDGTTRPQRIINYIHQLQIGKKKKLNEIKLILVGQGGVGKTSLVNRIISNSFDENESKTEGINISKWNIEIHDENYTINIWDFGGQEIMHATHQFFLTKRSYYVIVIDARQGEYESRIEYWLKMVDSFGDNSPAVIVINKSDQHLLDLNRRGLAKKYRFIKGFFDISCKTNLGIDKLKIFLQESLIKLPHVNDLIPEIWFEIKKELSNMKEDYISYNAYKNICESKSISDEISQGSLIELLHDLGIVINFRDEPRLMDTNVLNPEWVTNGVYTLLNSYELFTSRGVLQFIDMPKILDLKKYPKDKYAYIMSLMKKFEICFEFENINSKAFLIPDLLQKEEPDINWNYSDSVTIQFHYDILPSSIISRLIVRMNAFISQKTYWKSGVVLKEGGNKALVKSDEEDGIIKIWVSGDAETRRGFLHTIRLSLKSINETIPKLNSSEKVLFSNSLIDYNHLLTLERMGEKYIVPEGQNQRVNVKELLNGVDPRETKEEDLMAKLKEKKEKQKVLETKAEERVVSQEYYPQLWEKIVAFISAITILGLCIFLIVRNEPFNDQNLVVITRTILSLSVSALGATVPGFLHVSWSQKGILIRAGGALALFIVTYFWTPQVIK